jgi:hypothetical protein
MDGLEHLQSCLLDDGLVLQVLLIVSSPYSSIVFFGGSEKKPLHTLGNNTVAPSNKA